MNVLKFGGTSVGSPAAISALKQIVENEMATGQVPVVVVSAMSGVTNLLISMAADASEGKPYQAQLQELERRHFEVISELIGIQQQNPVYTRLKLHFNELDELLHGISSLRELSAKTQDTVLSYGERCSAFMISQILAQTYPGTVFTDASALIRTDDRFGNAQVQTEESERLIREYKAQHEGKLLVVTGFIASDNEGRITTLGRGGSDYTAAVFGAALGAASIEIWTDVNGMMTADPRIVNKAFSLDELSYTEAMELSYFGAKVIYPPTMIPAFAKKIPIIIRNTFEPSFAGTAIRHETRPSDLAIKGISSINAVSVINVQGSGMVGKAGFSGRLFSLLSRGRINIILITQSSSEHSISFAVQPADAIKALNLIRQEFELELEAKKLEMPVIENGLSVLAIVGENMKQTPGISGKLFHALGRNGINVRAIAQGSSEYNISVILSESDLSKALNAVHEAFFEALNKTLNLFCLGTGNIGSTLLRQLRNNAAYLMGHNDTQVKVIGISNTRNMLFNAGGISTDTWKEDLETTGQPADLAAFIEQMKSLNLPNSILVDNTASPSPVGFYEHALRASVSIVTCNKIANSGQYSQYKLLKDTARQHGADFYYETNVGAGLPIVRTLKDLMLSGDRITRIEAILSGTISFIFNQYQGDVRFGDIVKQAQELGYTEPDPRDDLNGTDFMRKILILARDAGHALEPADIQVENILPQACLQAQSVPEFYEQLYASEAHFNALKDSAAKEGKVLRYIARLEDGKAAISLQMVGPEHPFYSLSGSDNIISFTSERYKQRPMVVKGPGAGAEVTAAGVYADIINVGAR